MIKVLVRPMSGDEAQHSVDGNTLGVTLKALVAETFSVDPEVQKLALSNGNLLQDHLSLADQEVKDGDCLTLLINSFARVASGCLRCAQVFNVDTGKKEWEFQHATMVLSVAWSPDRQFLATSSADGIIRLFDVSSERSRWVLDRGFSGSISWSSDGQQIAAGCSTGEVRLLDTNCGGEITSIGAHEGAANCVTWTPGKMDQLASAGTDCCVHVLDIRCLGSGVKPSKSWTHPRALLSAAWRPDGQQLAAAGSEGVVLLHDVYSSEGVSAEHRLNPAPSAGTVRSLDWNTDGSQLAIAGNGVLIWKNPGPSGSVQKFNNARGLRSVSWSTHGDALVVGGDHGAVQVFDANSTLACKEWPEKQMWKLESHKVLSVAWQK